MGGLALAFLGETGHVGQWVGHGNEALQSLLWQCPDVVLVEQHMGGTPGSLLIRSIRESERYGDVAVILMTMGNTIQDHRFATRAGADGLLPKPLTPRPLAAAIDRVVAPVCATRGLASSRRGRG
ncbi:response regulator [Erythrobacter sp. SDW2]|uniref:response regulator n=1 Tax=Erythrobacter sp. SDW2 TaxID=2907154 RepID=UPI00351D4683